jgi:lysophospholipase L1-like esterase
MRIRRMLALTAVVALAAPGLAAPAAATTPTATPRAVHYRHYVALGDSYTAGPLIPLQRLDPVGCLRSTSNYPGLLSLRLGLFWSYADRSCSGADSTDMTNPQPVTLGTNPPQFDGLAADTDLVSVGIGGNDFGVFGNITSTCPALRASDPTGNPCQRHFTVNGVDVLRQQIAQTRVRVAAVIAGIHQRSPHATVLVVGYPRIAPPTGTCPDELPFADGDYPYLDGIEQALDAALSGAVSDTGGARYVDTYTPSLGHDACAGGAAWVNGQHLQLTAAPYHPNPSGMIGESKIIAAALGLH